MNLRRAWQRVELAARQARARSGWVDHAVAASSHYGRVNGNGQAGAVTYFAFLAFFPTMALAFFVVGLVANVFPEAQDTLVEVINRVFGGLIGDGEGQVSLQVFQDNAGTAGVIAVLGFLYAGIGWMSAMRNALQLVFAKPPRERPNLIVGKARDAMTFGISGVILLVAFVITSAVNRFSEEIIEALGFSADARLPSLALRVLGTTLALVLLTSLLVVLYQFLARPRVAHRALREGAVLASVGFVLTKIVADQLIALAHGSPAFAVFGFAFVLLVMINYFSRVMVFGAAWAYTSPKEPDLFPDEPTSPHWRP